MIFKEDDLETMSVFSIELPNSKKFELLTLSFDTDTTYYYLFDKVKIWKSKDKKGE